MDKISLTNIIEFRRKPEKSRQTFINNLKRPKEKLDEGGGDYWIIASSAISNLFRYENKNLISEKIEDIEARKEVVEANTTKNMYQRNIDILMNLEDFDFSEMKPRFELEYLSKPKKISVLTIRGVSVQVRPQHVFKYNENDIEKIGGIWFVSKLNGYSTQELVLFTDAFYRFLKHNYSEDYELDTKHCIAFDLTTLNYISYFQIEDNEFSSSLNSTLDAIKKLI